MGYLGSNRGQFQMGGHASLLSWLLTLGGFPTDALWFIQSVSLNVSWHEKRERERGDGRSFKQTWEPCSLFLEMLPHCLVQVLDIGLSWLAYGA